MKLTFIANVLLVISIEGQVHSGASCRMLPCRLDHAADGAGDVEQRRRSLEEFYALGDEGSTVTAWLPLLTETLSVATTAGNG